MFWIILIAAAVFAWRFFGGYPQPSRSYTNLFRSEVAILNAAGEVLFPAGGALSPGYDEAGITEYTDDYFGWHGLRNRTLMRLLLVLFEHATIVFVPSWQRMSQLAPAKRLVYLRGWAESDLYLRRMAFESLRAIMCMGYIGNPQVIKEMGIYRPAAAEKNAIIQRKPDA